MLRIYKVNTLPGSSYSRRVVYEPKNNLFTLFMLCIEEEVDPCYLTYIPIREIIGAQIERLKNKKISLLL